MWWMAAGALAASYAVVVGADRAPPGRVALLYARADAAAVRDAFVELGVVAADRAVLLQDPDPAALLAALLAVPADADRLYLYYSGHADGDAVFPNGKVLPIRELQAAFEAAPAKLRVGVLDACRGGAWTGAKGVAAAAPFVESPTASVGTVYVAASAGSEDAVEVGALGASVFTHHWLGGLRGPADHDRDRRITLVESFDWARERTVDASTVISGVAQHPTYRVELRGREDPVLVDLRDHRSIVTLRWDRGSVTVFDLDGGRAVADLGVAGSAQLALAPGRYLARRRTGAVVEVARFVVQADAPTEVSESAFVRAPSTGLLAAKGERLRRDLALAPRAGEWLVSARLGSRVLAEFHPALVPPIGLDVEVGLGDRVVLALPTPGVGVRVGRLDETEVLLYAGAMGLEFRADDQILVSDIGASADGRIRWSPRAAVAWSVGVSGTGQFMGRYLSASIGRTSSYAFIGLGASLSIGRSATLNPSIGAHVPLNEETALYSWGSSYAPVPVQWPTWEIGSTLRRGAYHVPLVQIHASNTLSLDLDVGLTTRLQSDLFDTHASAGVTWTPSAVRE